MIKRRDLETAYRDAIGDYLTTDADAGAFTRALDCGRAAVESGLTIADLGLLYSGVISSRSPERRPDEAIERMLSLERGFLTQSLVPSEVAGRRERDANAKLRELNATLEDDISARVVESQDLNATVEQMVAERTQTLRESEERFRLLAENAPDAVFRVSLVPEPHFEYVSPSNQAVFGFTPDEFYADYGVFSRQIYPDDRQLVSLTAEAPVEAATFRWIRKDGSIAWIDARITLSRNELGEVIAVEGIGRDVTGRMEAEDSIRRLNAELTEHVAEFKSLFDVLPVGVRIAHDAEFKTLTSNPAFARLTGLPQDSVNTDGAPIISRPNAEFRRSGRHVDTTDQPMHTAARTNNEVSDWVAEIARPDGTVVSIVAYATPLRDASGNVRGSIGAYVDITTIKAADESIIRLNAELRERVNEFQTLFDVMPVGVAIAHDLEVRSFAPNPALARLFDVPSVSVISTGETEVPAQPRGDFHRDGIAVAADQTPMHVAARTNAEVKDWEADLVLANGTVASIIGYAAPLRRLDGTVSGSIGAYVDVTAIKQVEEARRANLAKNEFLSRMSHELRTPLNAILGFGQLLEMDELEAGQGEAVEHILTAGHHLLQLIDEVLDISGIEAGRLSLSLEPVCLRDVLRTAMDLAGPLAASQSVKMVVTTPEALTTFVLADEQRLQQVLLNLLSNAAKYNRIGGTVRVAIEDRPDDRVRVWVRDTGTGIARENLGRLFSPFERIGAESSGIEGTGLGLAISKRLVEAMHGAIGVETHGHRGSDFWIDLPRVEDPLLQTAPELLETLFAPEESAAPARTVLYIEDNLSNLTLVERILGRIHGYRVLAAMRADRGIELAREHQPDVILLDLHLPDAPGVAVLAQLQADPKTAGIPVIVISADATRVQVSRLLSAGAKQYLTKPLHIGQFLEVVASAASRASDV